MLFFFDEFKFIFLYSLQLTLNWIYSKKKKNIYASYFRSLAIYKFIYSIQFEIRIYARWRLIFFYIFYRICNGETSCECIRNWFLRFCKANLKRRINKSRLLDDELKAYKISIFNLFECEVILDKWNGKKILMHWKWKF